MIITTSDEASLPTSVCSDVGRLFISSSLRMGLSMLL